MTRSGPAGRTHTDNGPPVALTMSEEQLQAAVIDLCRYLGLWCYHPYDSRRSTAGWVDLTILGRVALFVELKSEDGRRSRAQIRVAQLLEGAGVVYRLWRPSDLASGEITRTLEAIR